MFRPVILAALGLTAVMGAPHFRNADVAYAPAVETGLAVVPVETALEGLKMEAKKAKKIKSKGANLKARKANIKTRKSKVGKPAKKLEEAFELVPMTMEDSESSDDPDDMNLNFFPRKAPVKSRLVPMTMEDSESSDDPEDMNLDALSKKVESAQKKAKTKMKNAKDRLKSLRKATGAKKAKVAKKNKKYEEDFEVVPMEMEDSESSDDDMNMEGFAKMIKAAQKKAQKKQTSMKKKIKALRKANKNKSAKAAKMLEDFELVPMTMEDSESSDEPEEMNLGFFDRIKKFVEAEKAKSANGRVPPKTMDMKRP